MLIRKSIIFGTMCLFGLLLQAAMICKFTDELQENRAKQNAIIETYGSNVTLDAIVREECKIKAELILVIVMMIPLFCCFTVNVVSSLRYISSEDESLLRHIFSED